MKKNWLKIFLVFILTSFYTNAQNFQSPYFTMEYGKEWHYSSEDYPDTLISSIVDTATINGKFYYRFAPYGLNPNGSRYWLRPEPKQIFVLNMQDTTEYLLFDFQAAISESWDIPPDSSRWNLPVNQCDWGSTITLISNSDTVVNSKRVFNRCFLFNHFPHPCYDAGIIETWFERDFGMVRFSQVTEGGVIDWDLIVEKPDTTSLIGEYSIVGNPCLTNPCLPGVVCAIYADDTTYVLESDGSFFNDGNFSWNGYQPNINDSVIVTGVIIDRTDIFASEYFSIEIVDCKKYSVTSVPINSVKTEFLLKQNYPNPFNPTTVISFSIPRNSFVTLKVYDTLGKEVAILVEEEKQVGHYEINFDANNLSSGIYFYRIQAGSFSDTKKFILLR